MVARQLSINMEEEAVALFTKTSLTFPKNTTFTSDVMCNGNLLCYNDVDIMSGGSFRTSGIIETLEGGAIVASGPIQANHSLAIAAAATVSGLTVAKVTGLQTALGAKAPLAKPTFTGQLSGQSCVLSTSMCSPQYSRQSWTIARSSGAN